MKTLSSVFMAAALLVCGSLFTAPSFAADVDPPVETNRPPVQPPVVVPGGEGAPTSFEELSKVWIAIATPFVVGAVKMTADRLANGIPPRAIPYVAALVGFLLNWIGTQAGAPGVHWFLALFYGLGGVGFRALGGKLAGIRAANAVAALALIALLGTGCASGGGGFQAADAEVIAETAAATGSAIYLAAHPEKRPEFETAHAALGRLIRSTNVTSSDVIAALQKLPLKEFEGEKGTVMVAAVGAVTGLLVNRVEIKNDWAAAVARGLYNGLGATLAKPRGSIRRPDGTWTAGLSDPRGDDVDYTRRVWPAILTTDHARR